MIPIGCCPANDPTGKPYGAGKACCCGECYQLYSWFFISPYSEGGTNTSNMPFFQVRFTMMMEIAFAAKQTAKFIPTLYKESLNVTWQVLIMMILTMLHLTNNIPHRTTICLMKDHQTTHPSSMITPKDALPDGTSHHQ